MKLHFNTLLKTKHTLLIYSFLFCNMAQRLTWIPCLTCANVESKVAARPWIFKSVNVAISYFLNICNILTANKRKVYSSHLQPSRNLNF
jgi:hypothetical protein